MERYRIEKDVLGKVKIPRDAYYGSETARALDNFQISNMHLQQEFLTAYALLKKCAATANVKAGKLDRSKGNAIVRACEEIARGKLMDQFTVDIFQAGGGTSFNMNVNEVVANRAIEILKGKKGDYSIIHPNDHVNMSQSSNDTFPTAIRLSCFVALKELSASLEFLEKELEKKGKEFHKIVKVGRTHLQDAVPMRLGQEFEGYTGLVKEAREAIESSVPELMRLPIGGTAVGTGINAGNDYKKYVIQEINKQFHADFKSSNNLFSDMQERMAELELSNSLSETAVALTKIANDFRLLSSGPNAGINEITLPAVQPGSSIMPGKINPSMPEMLNMICFQVAGNGTAIREAVNAGQLELNVFGPVIAFNLLFSIKILSNGSRTFSEKCVRGIKPNLEKINEYSRLNLSVATALTPYIGYSKAAEIAKIAHERKKSVMEVCLEMRILDKYKLSKILDPKNHL